MPWVFLSHSIIIYLSGSTLPNYETKQQSKTNTNKYSGLLDYYSFIILLLISTNRDHFSGSQSKTRYRSLPRYCGCFTVSRTLARSPSARTQVVQSVPIDKQRVSGPISLMKIDRSFVLGDFPNTRARSLSLLWTIHSICSSSSIR